MKFACLVYVDGSAMAALTEEQGNKLKDDSIEFDWGLRRAGRLILCQPLASPDTAVTVRVRDGRLSSTDGPYVETKEFLGGFFLIEAADIAEARAIVETDPMVNYGSIEVRPFLEQVHSVTGEGRPGMLVER